MGKEPVIITACGALAGNQFKTTVTRVVPRESQEILLEHDSSKTSVLQMADQMHGLARSFVIPKQLEANRETGIQMASPFIMGWQPGAFFENLDTTITKYGNSQLQNIHPKERDKGLLICAVDRAYAESNLGTNAYRAGYRAVAGNAHSDQHLPIDQEKVENLEQLILLASKGGDQGKLALEELRDLAYKLGVELAEPATKIARMNGSDVNDVMKGNRFSLSDFSHYGKWGKKLMRLWDLRKHFAAGIKDTLSYDPNHVLCTKINGLDAPERPLVNVAEAIALQELINKGYMKISDVRAPYA